MRLTRLLAVVLFGFLLGWGGFAMPEAAIAAMPHHAVTTGAGAAADCDEQAGHHGHGDHHEHCDHQDQDHSKDHSKLSHNGCCVMACGMAALEPTELHVNSIEWTPARLQVGNDTLRDRSVSPLRRPPRPAA
jgi:hypothetical protein